MFFLCKKFSKSFFEKILFSLTTTGKVNQLLNTFLSLFLGNIKKLVYLFKPFIRAFADSARFLIKELSLSICFVTKAAERSVGLKLKPI